MFNYKINSQKIKILSFITLFLSPTSVFPLSKYLIKLLF